MRRRLRVAGLVAALVVTALVFLVPAIVEGSQESFDPGECNEFDLRVVEYARDPAELDYTDSRNARYENLTADQRALFERGYEQRETFVPISDGEYRMVREEMPSLVAFRGDVYDVGAVADDCPLVSGLPTAVNPVISVFLSLNALVTGPLAPVIVVVGGVALAFRLGRMLEY